MIKHSFEIHKTFVFYYNPESEIKTITGKNVNNDKRCLSIGYFVLDQNNSKFIPILHL